MNGRSTRAGFTLLEILIAMALLTIGVLGVANLLPAALHHARVAQERTTAAELADGRLGRLKMAGARTAIQNALEQEQFLTLTQVRKIFDTYSLYEGYFTTIQRMPGAAETGLQRVTFVVEMMDGRREEFVTYIADM